MILKLTGRWLDRSLYKVYEVKYIDSCQDMVLYPVNENSEPLVIDNIKRIFINEDELLIETKEHNYEFDIL